MLYAIGGFGLTLGISVPLNEELARFDAAAAGADRIASVRAEYESAWNAWNVVRTVCSTAAFAALVVAGSARPAPVCERRVASVGWTGAPGPAARA